MTGQKLRKTSAAYKYLLVVPMTLVLDLGIFWLVSSHFEKIVTIIVSVIVGLVSLFIMVFFVMVCVVKLKNIRAYNEKVKKAMKARQPEKRLGRKRRQNLRKRKSRRRRQNLRKRKSRKRKRNPKRRLSRFPLKIPSRSSCPK